MLRDHSPSEVAVYSSFCYVKHLADSVHRNRNLHAPRWTVGAKDSGLTVPSVEGLASPRRSTLQWFGVDRQKLERLAH